MKELPFARKLGRPPAGICWMIQLWKSSVKKKCNNEKAQALSTSSNTDGASQAALPPQQRGEGAMWHTERHIQPWKLVFMRPPLTPSLAARLRVTSLLCLHLLPVVLRKRDFATWLSVLEVELQREALNGIFSSSVLCCFQPLNSTFI